MDGGDDVLNVKRQIRRRIWKVAVFAAALGSLSYEFANRNVHVLFLRMLQQLPRLRFEYADHIVNVVFVLGAFLIVERSGICFVGKFLHASDHFRRRPDC